MAGTIRWSRGGPHRPRRLHHQSLWPPSAMLLLSNVRRTTLPIAPVVTLPSAQGCPLQLLLGRLPLWGRRVLETSPPPTVKARTDRSVFELISTGEDKIKVSIMGYTDRS